MKLVITIYLIFNLFNSIYSQSNLGDSLVAYYPMSGNAFDMTSFKNDGIVSGPELTEDRFGNQNSAYDFNGIKDQIIILDDNSLDLKSEATICAWIKPYKQELPYLGRIVSKLPKKQYLVYGLFHGHDHYISGQLDEASNSLAFEIKTSSNIVKEDQWSHIAMTWDGFNASIFVDGSLVARKLTLIDSIANSSGWLTIGYNDDAPKAFLGKIDEVMIFKRALSSMEIELLFEGNIPSIDFDGDGFISNDDCDDANYNINPNGQEIPNNGIDEDCDGLDLISSIHEIANTTISIYPNPATDIINIDTQIPLNFGTKLYDLNGQVVNKNVNTRQLTITSIPAGTYLLEIKDLNSTEKVLEKIIILK